MILRDAGSFANLLLDGEAYQGVTALLRTRRSIRDSIVTIRVALLQFDREAG